MIWWKYTTSCPAEEGHELQQILFIAFPIPFPNCNMISYCVFRFNKMCRWCNKTNKTWFFWVSEQVHVGLVSQHQGNNSFHYWNQISDRNHCEIHLTYEDKLDSPPPPPISIFMGLYMGNVITDQVSSSDSMTMPTIVNSTHFFVTRCTYNLSKREESTTDTEDVAMAADAIHGCREMPAPGTNTPERT